MKDSAIIYFSDTEYGPFAIFCSPENKEKVRCFIKKRYSRWKTKCKGLVGVSPYHDVLDAVETMRELLGDEKLRSVSDCTMVQLAEND